MMKPNIKTNYAFMAAIAIVGILGIRLHNEHGSKILQMRDISLANINALMDTENDSEKDTTDPEKENTIPTSRPLLGCKDFSVVIYCQAKCKGCGTLFRSVGGYGPTVDVKGGCNKCGSTSFSY